MCVGERERARASECVRMDMMLLLVRRQEGAYLLAMALDDSNTKTKNDKFVTPPLKRKKKMKSKFNPFL